LAGTTKLPDNESGWGAHRGAATGGAKIREKGTRKNARGTSEGGIFSRSLARPFRRKGKAADQGT